MTVVANFEHFKISPDFRKSHQTSNSSKALRVMDKILWEGVLIDPPGLNKVDPVRTRVVFYPPLWFLEHNSNKMKDFFLEFGDFC